jgi:hypothetical protein
VRRVTPLALALALCCAAPGQAQKLSDDERKEGFWSLFNGKDFTGWRFSESSVLPDKLPDNWKVEDGLIKLSGGGNPHLGSQWDYEDFDFRLEWNAHKEKYNSGVFVRSGRLVNANQINLAWGKQGDFITGGGKGARPVPDLQKPPGEWNEWRVLAVGDKVTFWCNGQMGWEATGVKPERGYLGLQAEGAAIDFRNLRVKELGFDNLTDAAKWGKADGWKIDEEGLTAAAKAGPLATAKADYQDFVFRVEWQADKGGTGAVGLGKAEAKVRLGDGVDGSGGVGGADARPAKKADNPQGQWNYLEVRRKGGKATAWLNGTVVTEDANWKGDAGPLVLEAAGLRFRNARARVAP